MSAGLKVNDPFKPRTCRFGDSECLVEPGKDCATMGIIYEITCLSCNQEVGQVPGERESRQPGGQHAPNYVGMSMTSAHSRMKDHLVGQRAKRDSNPLHRHDRDKHNGEVQRYVTRIIGREQRILPLTILEALFIESQVPGTTINDRNEYGRGSIVRISAS